VYSSSAEKHLGALPLVETQQGWSW
jgi:hypothetical protein